MSDEPTDDSNIDESAPLKPKPKREQSEKQKAVWAKAQQTRLDNAKLKKEALSKAIEDIAKKKKPKGEPPLAIEKAAPPPPKPKIVYESESDDEVVVVKKKKKKPKVVYESESESEEEPAPPPKPVKTKAAPAPVKLPETKPAIRFF